MRSTSSRRAVASRWAAAIMGAAMTLVLAIEASPTVADSDAPPEIPPATAPSRPRMASGNADETDMRDCLRNAVQAVNVEDLDGFLDCFTGGTQSKIRETAAIRFAQHDVSMELLDAHVVKAGKTTGELAVKYRLLLSDDRYDVVSLVAMKQEHSRWRISAEKILSYEHDSPRACSPSRYACLGASCRVNSRR